VSARVGDTVEWVNGDIVAHTATARNGAWDVMVGPNSKGSVVLKSPGTIEYYCRFHQIWSGRSACPDNRGKIFVRIGPWRPHSVRRRSNTAGLRVKVIGCQRW